MHDAVVVFPTRCNWASTSADIHDLDLVDPIDADFFAYEPAISNDASRRDDACAMRVRRHGGGVMGHRRRRHSRRPDPFLHYYELSPLLTSRLNPSWISRRLGGGVDHDLQLHQRWDSLGSRAVAHRPALMWESTGDRTEDRDEPTTRGGKLYRRWLPGGGRAPPPPPTHGRRWRWTSA